MAIAPPSAVAKGRYRFIEGTLDDVHRLPPLRNLDLPKPIEQGSRNNELWRHCMSNAPHVDSFDGLLDVARTFNDDCLPPMEDIEVISVATSAWGYTERGENRFGQHGAWFPLDEVNRLIDPDAFYLLAFLRAHQGPDATFMCANGLAEKFGWRRHRLAEARRTADRAWPFQGASTGGTENTSPVSMDKARAIKWPQNPLCTKSYTNTQLTCFPYCPCFP